ncbi:hypothetical protein C2G38_2233569 [Gigaspora rosea]|uniref:Uncharacterized protein n=1 Tax=Gigaspora rosea TaxID=44941 RepID=A0A397U0P4_9GLOM|nr:hypothetical protein C2G38_2233569 [Gigaspora rosea]
MANAIVLEFPNSNHHLCMYHIGVNLKKNLRGKLWSNKFQQFENDFFLCCNTLSTNLFESRWQSLKMKYPSAVQYINRQLEPLKVKWAACYNNTQFTAGANTIQREIQEILDSEAEYMRIEEYKDQIPTIGMMTVPKRFFHSIESIVTEFLMPSMVVAVSQQMKECFFYDTFKVDNINYNDLIKNQVDQDYDKEAWEDNYKASKIFLKEILLTVDQTKIVEIWRLAISGSLTSHYLILISDGSHRCTCNLLITHGILVDISTRFYDVHLRLTGTLSLSLNDDSSGIEHISNTSDLNLVYIKQLRGNEIYTPELRQINSNCIKYGRAQGIMRKMINLALDTNSYEEMIGTCQEFIFNKQQKLNHKEQDNLDLNVQNPIITTRKSRPAGRIKSSIEIQDNKLNRANILQSVDDNLNTQSINIDLNANGDPLEAKNTCKDKRKKCKNCGYKGHNRVTCKENINVD